MTPIQPVHEGDTSPNAGPKITALHAGLLFLINHQGNPPNVQQSLLAQLAPEVSQNSYGEVTRRMVSIFQNQLKNWPNYWPAMPKNIAKIVQSIPANCPGDVDAATAAVLNWLVETFRRLASPPPPRGNQRPTAILNKQKS
jgi:hypothetical protein